MYFLVNGKVDILVEHINESGEMAQRKISTMESPAYFGELGLIRKEPRAATVCSANWVELFFLTQSDWEDICRDHPELRASLKKATPNRTYLPKTVSSLMQGLAQRAKFRAKSARELVAPDPTPNAQAGTAPPAGGDSSFS
jgi:CRP-like cAMP-binding protein